MVQIFSMYRFSGQIVDTVDEMRSLTVTNHNKLLVVQEDFTVQVKDLLSDEKTPAFIFSTVDKVLQITHCACGNYVATVEGKQTFEKSDRLTIRIYTNWDSNKDENESIKRKISSKRLIRPRIAEVVTPSCYKMDEDFLDTIEIPISFTSPTLITTCQKTGKLLVVCGPTMHLFRQIYTRNQNGKSPYFMDFSAVPEVFQVDFFPLGVTICSNVIATFNESCVSAFVLKKVDKKTFKIISNNANESGSRNDQSGAEQNTSDCLESNCLKLNDVFKLVQENRNDALSNYLDSSSFPVIISIKGVNDVSALIKESTFPFKILTKQPNSIRNSERAKDTMVETLSEKELKIVAESLLALRIINSVEDCITKVALQILSHQTIETEENEESFCMGGNKFIGINLLVTTQLEGYLFHMSANNLEDGLRCVAVFNYTSRVINVIFETCFLHVLTETGIETYNIPTLRSTILFEKPDLAKYSRAISILGMHPFIGIRDFIGSNDLITIFTSASEKRTSKDSLPWTVYSLKMPDLFDVYQEMIEYSNSFKSRDDHTYKILSLESFLILQTAFTLRLSFGSQQNKQLALNTHQTNSNELAKIYFKSGNPDDIKIGCAVILASEIDPINFVNSLKSHKEEVINGIVCLVKLWISNNKNELTEERANWLIKLFSQIDASVELASFLLANESAMRSHGHKVVAFLRKRFDVCPEAADIRLVYGLCVIYSQSCLPDEATAVLKTVCPSESRRKSFLEVVAKYWTYLFDQILTNGKKVVSFSETASIIIEECPELMTEICILLTSIKTNFTPPIIAQMLLIPVPSQLSMLKRRNILHAFLESTLSVDVGVNWEDPTIQDCLRCLVVAYLTDCVKPLKTHDSSTSETARYSPLFTNELPDFVDLLPLPQTVNVVPLRRLQEMIWSRKLNDELMKDVLNSPSDPLLRLQLNAMLGSFDFIHQLMKYEFWEIVLPYAQVSCGNDNTKWKQFIALLWSKLEALSDENSKDRLTYQTLLAETLNRLARTVTPLQLSSMMESLTLKATDIYWKYLIKAEQYLYAKDLRAVIVNRVEQISCSDSTQ